MSIPFSFEQTLTLLMGGMLIVVFEIGCRREYEGYPHALVDQFCAMGFDVPRVVSGLKAMSIPPNIGRIPPEVMEEVVERLLTS